MNFDLRDGTAVLERTPGVLRALLAGLADRWIRPNEGAETWSAFDVVGHLIDGEETDWMPRARLILSQGPARRFEPYDRFRHLTVNREKTLGELLDRFAELRRANLDALARLALGPEQLRLTGEHPAFGSVTLEQLLATWVAHDLGHLAQIARVMAKQYRDAVGPWIEFLPVLRDRPRD
jgi:uncharacterized damage-inducible protein DinB